VWCLALEPFWACVKGWVCDCQAARCIVGLVQTGVRCGPVLDCGLRVRRQGCRAPDTPAAASAPAAPAGAPEPGGEAGAPIGSAPSLLADLLAAAVHARAAYGYAMAAGHLSSIAKFAMLHTARRPVPRSGRPALPARLGGRGAALCGAVHVQERSRPRSANGCK